jgi:hypothetical protein
MALRITHDMMTLGIDNYVGTPPVQRARRGPTAPARGVSPRIRPLLTRGQGLVRSPLSRTG